MGRLHRKPGCVGREKHEDFQGEKEPKSHFCSIESLRFLELQTQSARQGVKFPVLREENDQEEHRDNLASALRPKTVRPRGNLAKQTQTAARVM